MRMEAAGWEDIPAISRLYEELYACVADLQPEIFRPARQSGEFIRSMIDSGDGDFLVARGAGGEAQGFALVRRMETPEYPCFILRRYTQLMDLVVAEPCRGQGVGRALLDQVERWARERGSQFVELGVLSENLPAIRAYTAKGFVERRKIMELDLTEKGT